MTIIRLAKKEDAIAIALLGRTTFSEAFGGLFSDRDDLKRYLDQTFAVDKIEKSLGKSNNRYWIASVDRLPVGYAKLKIRSPSAFVEGNDTSQLQKIYVLQDFLEMKIGRRLQDILMKNAQNSGSRHIWLSVYEANKRAIRFYEKNDFRPVGKHQFRIGKLSFNFKVMCKSFQKA
nr:GNAT family N-acetyltransferase [uncultured Allomuricauda sp.]